MCERTCWRKWLGSSKDTGLVSSRNHPIAQSTWEHETAAAVRQRWLISTARAPSSPSNTGQTAHLSAFPRTGQEGSKQVFCSLGSDCSSSESWAFTCLLSFGFPSQRQMDPSVGCSLLSPLLYPPFAVCLRGGCTPLLQAPQLMRAAWKQLTSLARSWTFPALLAGV